jgi:hypothetical protein
MFMQCRQSFECVRFAAKVTLLSLFHGGQLRLRDTAPKTPFNNRQRCASARDQQVMSLNEFLKKHKTLQERLIAVELETTTDYPKTVANAIDYVKFYSRSPDAVIRVYQK